MSVWRICPGDVSASLPAGETAGQSTLATLLCPFWGSHAPAWADHPQQNGSLTVPPSARSGSHWETGQGQINSMSFDPRVRVVCGGVDGTLKVFDAQAAVTGGGAAEPLVTLDGAGSGASSAMGWDPYPGNVGIRSIMHSQMSHSLWTHRAGHQYGILCHQQGSPGSPDTLASGGTDSTAKIWWVGTFFSKA